MRKNDNADKAYKDAKSKSKSDSGPHISHAVDMCLSLASRVQCAKVRIYNLIREVGRGETTADNALHCLVEDYKNLGDVAEDLGRMSEMLAAVEGANG